MILLAKMLEVCSTTLPQVILPHLYSHPNYNNYLASRLKKYEKRANEAVDFFKNIPNVRVNKPKGVFYLVLELLDLPHHQLNAKNKAVRLFLDDLLKQTKVAEDFQFSYELMASKGVCVVPLTGFGSTINGFRMTLLQENDAVFTQTLEKIGNAINEYYQT